MKSVLRLAALLVFAGMSSASISAGAQTIPPAPPAEWKITNLEGSHPVYSACYSIPGVKIWKYRDGTGARMEIWVNPDEKMGIKETVEIAFFESAAREKATWMNFKKPGLSFPKAKKKGPDLFQPHERDLATLPDDGLKSMILSAFGIK